MRAPTGSVEWGTDAWYARITMPDGRRPRIRLDGVPRADRARAVEIARAMAAQVRTGGGYVPESRLETVTEYVLDAYCGGEDFDGSPDPCPTCGAGPWEPCAPGCSEHFYGDR